MNDDDFNAPNPFRSGGASSNDTDLLGPSAGAPPQQQQLQQPPPLQQQAYAAPPPQQQQQYPPQQHPQQQQFQQPDPNSGMVGNFQMPPQTPPHLQQQQQQQQPYGLSGQMDQNVNRSPQQQQQRGGGAGGGEISSTPFGYWQRCTSCFRIEGYLPYFDVDTRQVADRFAASLFRFLQPDYFRTSVIGDDMGTSSGSLEAGSNDRKGPDLYGPFWVTMTLIFLIAATSNMSAYMHHAQKMSHQSSSSSSSSGSSSSSAADVDSNSTAVPYTPDATTEVQDVEEFEYDIRHLLRAATTLTVFAWAAPTFFWLACNCLGMPNISWAMWMCVYGYSMTPYLIACALAWIPVAIVEWLVLAIATAASVMLILRNLSTPLLAQDGIQQAKAAPVLMSVLGVHVIFLLVLKFAFYHG